MTECPVCSGRLRPTKLSCEDCGVTVEGELPVSRFSILSEDQQHFVESFLIARGNIREAEKLLGISYPTVRRRLDEVVHALGHPTTESQKTQMELLDGIEEGSISAKEAINRLRGGDA
jgi:hypothetical protein